MTTNSSTVRESLTQTSMKRAVGYKVKRIKWSRILIVLSSLTIAFIVCCALFPQWMAPYSPTEMDTQLLMQPPNLSHIFGTDQFGRDIFSLIVYGARHSLLTGVSAVILGGLTGTLIGLIAGYVGGIIDTIFMRVIDIVMTIPNILLAIAISSALGASLINIILAISVATVPGYARVIRSQVISIKSRPFVDASRSIGTSHFRILMRHILPNCFSPLLVMATVSVGASILLGAGLSFLGLSVVQEIPDWGYLLSQGRSYITVAWWIVTFPGLAITILVISINLLGDELRNRLDPKQARA